MRGLISIAMSSMLAGACAPGHGTAHRIAYVVDGAFVTLGTIELASTIDEPCGDVILCARDVNRGLGWTLLATGAAGAFVNTLVATPNDPDVRFAPSPSELPPPGASAATGIPYRRGPLGALAIRISIAARVGRCDVVRIDAPTLIDHAPDYFDEVLAAEPAIAVCLR